MTKKDLYHKIEAYLYGQLSDAEIIAFEKELQSDASLAKEVNLHRKVHAELGNADKRALRQKLDELGHKYAQLEQAPKQKNRLFIRLLWIISAILLLLFLAWFFLKKNTAKLAPQPNYNIANASNYNPWDGIASLENQLASTARNSTPNKITFSLSLHDKSFQPRNGKIALRLVGTCLSNSPKEILILSIFSNRKSDFEKDKTIFRASIPLISEEEQHFDFAKELELPPGLYYYFMTTAISDKDLFLGRFTVDQSSSDY